MTLKEVKADVIKLRERQEEDHESIIEYGGRITSLEKRIKNHKELLLDSLSRLEQDTESCVKDISEQVDHVGKNIVQISNVVNKYEPAIKQVEHWKEDRRKIVLAVVIAILLAMVGGVLTALNQLYLG